MRPDLESFPACVHPRETRFVRASCAHESLSALGRSVISPCAHAAWDRRFDGRRFRVSAVRDPERSPRSARRRPRGEAKLTTRTPRLSSEWRTADEKEQSPDDPDCDHGAHPLQAERTLVLLCDYAGSDDL